MFCMDGHDQAFVDALAALNKACRSKERIRGLDVRVLLAQARVAALLDPEEAESRFFDVAYHAQQQGITDAEDGIN